MVACGFNDVFRRSSTFISIAKENRRMNSACHTILLSSSLRSVQSAPLSVRMSVASSPFTLRPSLRPHQFSSSEGLT